MRLFVATIIVFLESFSLDAATHLKLYRPFGDNSLEASRMIETQMDGECLQQSKRIEREDAWQCVAQGKIYDPCFIKQYSAHNQAICPLSPWNGISVQIDLKNPVDNTGHKPLDLSRTFPWAVELGSGEKCVANDAGGIFQEMPIHYQCDNQSFLFGHLQRCNTTWTMLRHGKEDKVETIVIEKAWF